MRFLKVVIPFRKVIKSVPLAQEQLVPVVRPEYRLPGSLSENGIPEFQFHLLGGCLNEERDRVFTRADQPLSPTELANAFRLWLLEVMSAANPLPYDFEIRGYDTDPADEEE